MPIAKVSGRRSTGLWTSLLTGTWDLLHAATASPQMVFYRRRLDLPHFSFLLAFNKAGLETLVCLIWSIGVWPHRSRTTCFLPGIARAPAPDCLCYFISRASRLLEGFHQISLAGILIDLVDTGTMWLLCRYSSVLTLISPEMGTPNSAPTAPTFLRSISRRWADGRRHLHVPTRTFLGPVCHTGGGIIGRSVILETAQDIRG